MYSIWIVLILFMFLAGLSLQERRQVYALLPLHDLLQQRHIEVREERLLRLQEKFKDAAKETPLPSAQMIVKTTQQKQRPLANRFKVRPHALYPPEGGKLDVVAALQKRQIHAGDTYGAVLQRLLMEAYCDSFAEQERMQQLIAVLSLQYQKEPCVIEKVEDLLALLPVESYLEQRELLCKMLAGSAELGDGKVKRLERFLTTPQLCHLSAEETPLLNIHFAEPELIQALFDDEVADEILFLRDDVLQKDGLVCRTCIRKKDLKQYGVDFWAQIKAYESILSFEKRRQPKACKHARGTRRKR